jgi:NADH-quinone oxidoreductase subunit A
MTHTFLPVLIMLFIAVAIGATILGLSWILGRHQRNPSKLSPYESGVPMLDVNRKRVNVRFYQIAMLFILFDIEAAFLYPWAVIYRETSQGPWGMFLFGEMLVFIAFLAVGYIYVWKKKAFDWNAPHG